MSDNCIHCMKNERTGGDLMCDSCRDAARHNTEKFLRDYPEESGVIHRLRHTEPEGWPDAEMMEAAQESKTPTASDQISLGMVKSNGVWFEVKEWLPDDEMYIAMVFDPERGEPYAKARENVQEVATRMSGFPHLWNGSKIRG